MMMREMVLAALSVGEDVRQLRDHGGCERIAVLWVVQDNFEIGAAAESSSFP